MKQWLCSIGIHKKYRWATMDNNFICLSGKKCERCGVIWVLKERFIGEKK